MSAELKGSRVGEINVANNGMKMRIIAYRKHIDIDVQFEDGTIVYNKTYSSFKKGCIGYPIKNRVGEVSTAKNGMKMRIMAYRNCGDIDIEFEDGTIIHNRSYDNFKKGTIRYPLEKREGEVNVATNGMKMRIITYRNYNDIDVQFEDGTIIYNKGYTSFKKGEIKYPLKDRVGEVNTANNGMKMRIIAYRSATDIDIQFEDGTIVYNKDYSCFERGNVGYPIKDRVGEVNITNNGMKMKIIAYRRSDDIDIQFEDGTIVCGKSYDNFKKGNIRYHSKRVEEVNIANNGMKMKIIAYRGSMDIDIQFEDGTVVCNKTYTSFKTGRVGHPLFAGKSSINFYGFKVVKVAYRKGNDVYYLCEKDGEKSIQTLQQIFKSAGVDEVF